MRNYGAELEDLWPINPRDKLYQGFPSTAGDSDWDAKFQNYIDDVFDTLEEKDRPEALVRTSSNIDFGLTLEDIALGICISGISAT